MSTDPTFRMTVQDIFAIKGRGTVVTGRIESGVIAVGNEIRIQGKTSSRTVQVSGVEMRRKVITQAQVGDDVGILLRDVEKEDIQQGDILLGSDADFTWKP
ncbi:MAG TPA: EF-Tu/IF-2/RF-3 family GTPase [Anaerolineales bacterium]|nr:EF-Tu/IF-2/RF-3 family GTPase [Anaerolineales bacterium]